MTADDATRAIGPGERPVLGLPGPGSVVAGRYRLLDTVGQGGMGIVWRAHDETLDRTVAVKQLVLPPKLTDEERDVLRERVLREARAAARLHDPAAVTVYDVVTHGDSPWLIMELVDATSLSQLIRSDGPRPVQEAARIGLAVLGALEAAHHAGIVHRDVKPGNVMICANGRILLADFGIASTQGDPSLTDTGLLLGSPAYISPERAQGQPGGPEGDLWALGQTLYTAVEGVPAYESDTALATLTAVVHGHRREPLRAGALLPAIDRLTDPDPATRAKAPEARRLLQQAVEGRAVAAEPATTVMRQQTQVLPTVRPQEEPPIWAAREPAYAEPPYSGPGYEELSTERPPSSGRRRAVIAVIALLSAAAIVVGVLFGTGTLSLHKKASVGGGNIPAGWVKDDEGVFSIYHPAPWTRLSVPGGGYAFGLSQELYERVLVVKTQAPMDYLSGIDAAKQKAGIGYKRLQLTQNSASESDLEWTEIEGGTTYHLLDRAYLSNNRLYTLLFFAPDAQWSEALPTFQAISGTFLPEK